MKEINQNKEAYQKNNLFDFDNSLVLHYYPQRIVDILSMRGLKRGSLLELGLGHGYSAETFFSLFDDYTILDGDPDIIAQFKENHPSMGIHIVETYFETFEDTKKYDVIVAGYVLEHVNDPEGVLYKYKNFLKKDGRMFITVPNATSMHRQLGHIAGDLPDMMTLSKTDIELGHKRYFTVESLKELVKKAGFSVVSIEGMFLKPVTTSQMLSLNFEQKYLDAFCVLGRDYPELSSSILMECKW